MDGECVLPLRWLEGLDADRVGTGVAVGLIQGPGKAVGDGAAGAEPREP